MKPTLLPAPFTHSNRSFGDSFANAYVIRPSVARSYLLYTVLITQYMPFVIFQAPKAPSAAGGD